MTPDNQKHCFVNGDLCRSAMQHYSAMSTRECISRQAAMDAVDEAIELSPWDMESVIKSIESAPAADVVPAIRGEWVLSEGADRYRTLPRCSICGVTSHNYFDAAIEEEHFCYNCGARMKRNIYHKVDGEWLCTYDYD